MSDYRHVHIGYSCNLATGAAGYIIAHPVTKNTAQDSYVNRGKKERKHIVTEISCPVTAVTCGNWASAQQANKCNDHLSIPKYYGLSCSYYSNSFCEFPTRVYIHRNSLPYSFVPFPSPSYCPIHVSLYCINAPHTFMGNPFTHSPCKQP